MNNDYEKLNSERAHSLSRARRRKALQRRRIMVATIAGVVALVLIIGTVFIVKKVHSKNDEADLVAENVEIPSKEDEDAVCHACNNPRHTATLLWRRDDVP